MANPPFPPEGKSLEPSLACPVLVEDPGSAGDTGDLIRGEGVWDQALPPSPQPSPSREREFSDRLLGGF